MVILVLKFLAGLIAAIIATKLIAIKAVTAGRTWRFAKWEFPTERLLSVGALWIALTLSTGTDVWKYNQDRKTAKAQAVKEEELVERQNQIKELASKANVEIDKANVTLKDSATTLSGVATTTDTTLGRVNLANDKLEESAGTLGEVVDLADSVIDKQQQQIQQMNKISLDRDLSELEISFIPSHAHWSEISAEFEKLEAADPTKIGAHYYQYSTMLAENQGDHWKISFSSMRTGISSSTFSTNQPDGKPFERIIQTVNKFLFLTIKFANDTTIKFIDSGRTTPTLISITRNNITFRFRPPHMKLNLGVLNGNSIVTFSGRGDLERIRLRSLDPGVVMNETIDLKWDRDDYEGAPDISGPHPLKIIFKSLSP